MDIILASKSPRRKTLLEKANINFKIFDSRIDEKKIKFNENPAYYCKKLAEKKCAFATKKFKKSLIIGADTIVYHNKMVFNKPKNKKEAIYHLNTLSGKTHTVYTGVCLIIKEKNIKINFYDKTYVEFHKINDYYINHYIDNYKPYDKAGSYGIQDWSMIFVKRINGCFNNVVGFPVSKFYKLASENKVINKIIKLNKINV